MAGLAINQFHNAAAVHANHSELTTQQKHFTASQYPNEAQRLHKANQLDLPAMQVMNTFDIQLTGFCNLVNLMIRQNGYTARNVEDLRMDQSILQNAKRYITCQKDPSNQFQFDWTFREPVKRLYELVETTMRNIGIEPDPSLVVKYPRPQPSPPL
jgi:hypothetical protein